MTGMPIHRRGVCERDLFVHMRFLAALLIHGERIHEGFQTFAVGKAQLHAERMCQPAFQAAFPAFTPVVQVGPAPGELAGRVHQHTLGGPHETDHLPLG